MMRLLHVCESVIGGTGSYLSELVPAQVALYGAESIALLVPESQLNYLEPQVLESGVRLIPFSRKSRFQGLFNFIGVYLKTRAEFRPDVVHAHSSFAGLVVRGLGFGRDYKVVFCPHGWSVDMKGARFLRLGAELVERMLSRSADQVILISRHEHKRARDLGFTEDRLSLVVSGIRADAPDGPAAEWNDDRLKVLYAGRFDFQKGVDVLLDAVEGQEDALSVRLVGNFVVNELKLPEKLPSHVTNLGWLDRAGVYAQMRSCDVLVVPSRWEGFGLVAIEAMRLGVPVLASAVGGLKEILGDGQYGIVVPSEDPGALRERLLSLTREDLRAIAARGRARFLSTYSLDRMVREIDAVYARILAK
ncbi:glycosyltransferase [Xanthobacter autotrophicus]|uniref:glycosyltransferase n=1 Tax=Xanthobacter TaxID=279 RepID=UPI0024AAC290|nr:glycosyltransferase [Xanthobacter autotrophicus]MDI4664839.1 glycosyltransferase [Xanthobacter autotrophicus]